MHVCIQRFDDAIEMLNVEEHYYVNNTFNKDNHSLMDPIRKLYIDKCNDNINLREEIQAFKTNHAYNGSEDIKKINSIRKRSELFDSMLKLERYLDQR